MRHHDATPEATQDTVRDGHGDAAVPAPPRFLDAGEAALVVEFGRTVDPGLNDRVLDLDAHLRAAMPAGVGECVPTYRSLTIHYDPLRIDRVALIAVVEEALRGGQVRVRDAAQWTLPCCYATGFGEDLGEAAGLLGLMPDDLGRRHAEAIYRVYMYGFAPGFAYLGGLPEELSVARRDTPRPPHPPGAIMIGGGLCAVGTFPMPTGWYVLGRTPERLYAPERPEPFLIRAGDGLRFEAVEAETFRALERRAAGGEIVARREAV